MDKYTELEEKARAATCGEWYECSVHAFQKDRCFVRSKHSDGDYAVCETWGGGGPSHKDGEYIAAASPRVILELLAEITDLKDECSAKMSVDAMIELKGQRDTAIERVKAVSADLSEAVKYLKEGKARFTPNTTNSLVDDFLGRMSDDF